jgi:hypothetical protein
MNSICLVVPLIPGANLPFPLNKLVETIISYVSCFSCFVYTPQCFIVSSILFQSGEETCFAGNKSEADATFPIWVCETSSEFLPEWLLESCRGADQLRFGDH